MISPGFPCVTWMLRGAIIQGRAFRARAERALLSYGGISVSRTLAAGAAERSPALPPVLETVRCVSFVATRPVRVLKSSNMVPNQPVPSRVDQTGATQRAARIEKFNKGEWEVPKRPIPVPQTFMQNLAQTTASRPYLLPIVGSFVFCTLLVVAYEICTYP